MNTESLRKAEVVVIGGGAAGMMAALTAAERGKSVVLLEPNDKLGRKLRITGKGRCNCTNHCSVKEFLENVPTNPKFLMSSLNAFPPEKVMDFFESIGVPLKTERGNRVFPVSDSANDLADRLASAMRAAGVSVKKTRARALCVQDGRIVGVKTADDGVIECDAVIVATGGKSYPLTGSKGDGYTLAQACGHSISEPKASLVPLESPDEFCPELSGFAPRNVTLSVCENGKLIFKELGEMLFAHFGVTGPLVLSASCHMHDFGTKKYELFIDFKPALDEQKLDERILRDFARFSNRDFGNALDELAAKSFIPVLVRLSGIPAEKKVHSVTKQERKKLVSLLKAFPVQVTGPRPIDEAIVTSGGVNVREIDPRTMQSKLVGGLYFAGEVLDVDAYTGGFNLQIAWSTGRCAGLHAGKDPE